jgi:superfamily II DNA or RNA helicase
MDVAMVQTLARHKTLDELLARYGHIVIDECHHVPAVMTERILGAAPARYVTGLTATPKRRDGHHPIIAMQCGQGRQPLVLTERREHLERLAAHLANANLTLITLHGEMRPAEQRAAREQLASGDVEGGPRVVLAIGRYIGEGFDNSRLDTLILAMPIAWKAPSLNTPGG